MIGDVKGVFCRPRAAILFLHDDLMGQQQFILALFENTNPTGLHAV
jgi:hypothetical protein